MLLMMHHIQMISVCWLQHMDLEVEKAVLITVSIQLMALINSDLESDYGHHLDCKGGILLIQA